MRPTGFVLRVGLVLGLAALAGCDPGQGKVAGRVLYDGAPLPGGLVTFRPADPRQNAVSAELDAQGNYAAVLPVGEVQVSIDNREMEPRAPRPAGLPPGLPPEVGKALGGAKTDGAPPKAEEPPPERPRGRYVKIPERYHDVATSGLRFTVGRGEQKQDFELTK
jgi:hypothetical protein